MNNIITTNPNGQPFEAEDVALIQSNLKELTTALSKQLSGSSDIVRLYGAELSVTGSGGLTPTLSITKGAIWYLDEIYMVDAVVSQALTAGTTSETVKSTWSWDLSSTDSNSRSFKYGGVNNTFRNRKSVYVQTPTTWTGLNYDSSPLIADSIHASIAETIAGSVNTKYVTPAVLGRQGDNFNVTYPAYVTSTAYYGTGKYTNGYFSSVTFDGEFTMLSDQDYVDITLDFPLISYGYIGGVFSIPAKIMQGGYFTSYTNLIAEIVLNTPTTTLRVYRNYVSESLALLSGASSNHKFKSGQKYSFTFKYCK